MKYIYAHLTKSFVNGWVKYIEYTRDVFALSLLLTFHFKKQTISLCFVESNLAYHVINIYVQWILIVSQIYQNSCDMVNDVNWC